MEYMEDVRRLLGAPAGMGDPLHQVQLILEPAELQIIIEIQEDLHLIGNIKVRYQQIYVPINIK